MAVVMVYSLWCMSFPLIKTKIRWNEIISLNSQPDNI